MRGFESDEDFERIPYDEVPISRNYSKANPSSSYGSTTKNNKNGGIVANKLTTFFISFLVLLNFVLGIIIVNLFVEVKKPTSVNNLDITIDSTVASDVLNAATKAKFSAVCVNAGTSAIYDLEDFYNLNSRGSGVIIDIDKEAGDAYILTCYHVVMTSLKTTYPYVYILPLGCYEPIQAEVVNFSYTEDIALLKVTNSPVLRASLATACEVADSSYVVEGQTAIAIGNALNLGLSVTSGVVSSPINLIKVSSNSSMRAIKVDTAINGGNSGCGLFDVNGKLIGIVNAKLQSVEVDNVAYAIPSNVAVSIANAIKYYGSSTKPVYGIVGLYIKIDSNGTSIETSTGGVNNKIVVSSVDDPAYTAGIRKDDVLISFSYGDKVVKVKNLYDISDHAYNFRVGDIVKFKVLRGEETLEFNVVIASTKDAGAE